LRRCETVHPGIDQADAALLRGFHDLKGRMPDWAKRAVEIAIEEDEAAGMAYLK
jgi:hypothetical protein